MASTYNLEPQPTAKVVLHTTSGDISLELFAQQTPITSRNFLQLCLDGYYDNTIFHRLVPGFIIQGGDPTGTGSGGQSSLDNGRPFEDEFHTRLKFNRRGLLGMANTGVKNDNGSQFFLTLGKTEELTNHNTMFGRVEAGNTIYNLVKMGEAELTEEEASDRPMYPTRIINTEILVNPFDDMEKRMRQALPTAVSTGTAAKKPTKKKKPGKQILSFGGGDSDDESTGGAVSLVKKKLANPSLATSTELPDHGKPSARPPKRPGSDSVSRQMEERPPKRRSPPRSAPNPATVDNPISRDSSPEPEATRSEKALSKAQTQIAELKASLRRETASTHEEPEKKQNALEAMIPDTATRGRRRKGVNSANSGGAPTSAEQKSLDAFNAFKQRLTTLNSTASKSKQKQSSDDQPADTPQDSVKPAQKPEAEAEDEEAELCDLHFVPNCESCKKWDAQDGDGDEDDAADDDDGWMAHKLTFEKDRRGKDLEWKRQNERIQELVEHPRRRPVGDGDGARGGGWRQRGGRERR